MNSLIINIILLAVEVFFYVIAPITVIVLLAFILKNLKKTAGVTGSAATPAPKSGAVSATVSEPEDEVDDSELVAVITAAIHAYEAAQGNTAAGNLVVRSIKQRNRW